MKSQQKKPPKTKHRYIAPTKVSLGIVAGRVGGNDVLMTTTHRGKKGHKIGLYHHLRTGTCTERVRQHRSLVKVRPA